MTRIIKIFVSYTLAFAVMCGLMLTIPPQIAFADGNIEDKPSKSKKKTKTTKSQLKTYKVALSKCYSQRRLAQEAVDDYKARIKVTKARARKANDQRAALKNKRVADTKKAKKLTKSLRSGKNADGSKMTLAEKDNLVRQINKLNAGVRSSAQKEEALEDSVKDSRKWITRDNRDLGNANKKLRKIQADCKKWEKLIKDGS